MESLVRSIIPITGIFLTLMSCGTLHHDGMMVNVDGGDSAFVEGLHPGNVIGHPDSAQWRAIPPLDTISLLHSMCLKESASVMDTLITGDTTWYAEEDTIIVRYVAYACTCPDHDLVDTTRFKGIKGFYVLPASGTIRMPLRLQVSGNTFELIGRRSQNPYPISQGMGPPMPGYCFRYRSYRIVTPYKVWGPEVLDPSLDALDSLQLWGGAMQFKVE